MSGDGEVFIFSFFWRKTIKHISQNKGNHMLHLSEFEPMTMLLPFVLKIDPFFKMVVACISSQEHVIVNSRQDKNVIMISKLNNVYSD